LYFAPQLILAPAAAAAQGDRVDLRLWIPAFPGMAKRTELVENLRVIFGSLGSLKLTM
jgi:hypothetical protein